MCEVIVDINTPREVSKTLNRLGYDAMYMTDELERDASDREIMELAEERNAYVVTRDRTFSPNEMIVLKIKGESIESLVTDTIKELLLRECYPSSIPR